jgi:hypothetical protein
MSLVTLKSMALSQLNLKMNSQRRLIKKVIIRQVRFQTISLNQARIMANNNNSIQKPILPLPQEKNRFLPPHPILLLLNKTTPFISVHSTKAVV